MLHVLECPTKIHTWLAFMVELNVSTNAVLYTTILLLLRTGTAHAFLLAFNATAVEEKFPDTYSTFMSRC